MKDNPNFITNDEWFEKCDQLAQELKKEKAKSADLEKRLNFHIEFGEKELLKAEQKSAKLVEVLKSECYCDEHDGNKFVCPGCKALAEYEAGESSKGDGNA